MALTGTQFQELTSALKGVLEFRQPESQFDPK